MTHDDSESNSTDLDERSDQPKQTTGRTKWVLTEEALNKLLDQFSSNREEAGGQYELMRVKLVRFFEWHRSSSPEDLADETINRVARRIEEGEIIANLPAYFSSVARWVFTESIRPKVISVPIEEIQELPAEEPFEDEQKEGRLNCLDRCLDKLSVESRSLILKYYQDERRAKIDYRKQLSEALGIPLNALRIRAHRIRNVLEKCVSECLAQQI